MMDFTNHSKCVTLLPYVSINRVRCKNDLILYKPLKLARQYYLYRRLVKG